MSETPAAGTTTIDADLDGAVWLGLDLDEVALEGCTLRRLRAGGGTWTRTSILDGDLTGADLAGLVTTDCSLVRSTVDGARLTGSQWLRSRWREVGAQDLVAESVGAHGSAWADVTLTGCRLAELDLTNARLERVRLSDCDLSGARFAGARCTDVTMTGCVLDGVTGLAGLRGATLAWSDGVSLLPAMAAELGIGLQRDGGPSGDGRR